MRLDAGADQFIARRQADGAQILATAAVVTADGNLQNGGTPGTYAVVSAMFTSAGVAANAWPLGTKVYGDTNTMQQYVFKGGNAAIDPETEAYDPNGIGTNWDKYIPPPLTAIDGGAF